ncbi:MAG TPA: hypothetical protein PKE57_03310 [Cellvibrionaceae bacterium]|nr:hypothetical protein [Cellvibrionaceae bacterium]HMW71943.1 hypothetical protein [Cellvibrionaceae bacterium]HNG58539.1 hypothetical protein [Cellvibrionaceae bacterium]
MNRPLCCYFSLSYNTDSACWPEVAHRLASQYPTKTLKLRAASYPPQTPNTRQAD